MVVLARNLHVSAGARICTPREKGSDMPSQLQQVTIFSSRRYNENRDTQPRLARAYLAILNKTADVEFATGNIGDLLHFLSSQHKDAHLAKAAKEVLEHFGALT